ncbi:Epsilon-trimethyllysine 2-oxoglutarate dioxygenase [Operophtera brumata]|uniref:Epsilon-trimethyllysine 2-oxoglutarate dioxygenase n=1 Tax=Operophtera brumata TaxID=104452 RepID=A0A0L7LBT6_OPEBR|nr:Epsilon-trimethyllysine 2-oxoglutarate dioxygenase [Operophtera brumata]
MVGSLQVLHCLEHLNPVGGETILVDGFYGAEHLKQDCPECYEFLTTFDVEAEYIEDGHHHTSYYRSLRKLGQYYENPENQWQFKLSPGTVMVMDNFRVLHGRTGFSGQRILCGSYVSRSDWLDKARSLGLIN